MVRINLDLCPSTTNFMVAVYICFEMVIRRINRAYNHPIPPSLVSSLLCTTAGALFYMYEPMGEDYQGITYMPPQDMLAYFMPIYATTVIYQMDFFLYTKTLLHVFLIFGVGFIISSTLVCLMIFYIIHPEWDIYESILYTLIVLPVQPVQVIFLFREIAKFKNIATILEAESIGTFVPIYFVFQYFRAIHSGYLEHWRHHVLFLVWKLLGGCFVGAIFGRITTSLLIILYNASFGALCFLLGMNFVSYFLAEYLLCVSGNLTIMLMAAYIVVDRKKFALQVDENISQFYHSLQTSMEISTLCLYATESIPYILTYFSPTEVYASLMAYFTVNFVRLAVFLMFVFFLKNIQLDIDFDMRTGVVLGLSGVKGSFNMIMAFMLVVDPVTFALGRDAIIEVMFMYMYTLIVNATPMRLVLRLMGLTELSTLRRTNMNYCMKFVNEARSCIIKTLKSFKYLAGTNWQLVRNETTINHPYYKKSMYEEDEEDEHQIFEANAALCPDCFKEIPYDLTDSEMEELCFEARSKILKAKKISVIRQYETGAINKNCAQVLQHNIDMMLDTNRVRTKLDVDVYMKPNNCLVLIRRFLAYRLKQSKLEIPTGSFHRFCYFLTNHVAYDYTLMSIIPLYIAFVIYFYVTKITVSMWSIYVSFVIVFIVNFAFTLFSLKRLRRFFRMKLFMYDFICCSSECALLASVCFASGLQFAYLKFTLLCVSLTRTIYWLSLMQSIFSHIIDGIDRRIDMRITFGYDIAAALEFCCNEILESIGQIVEIKVIRDIYINDLKYEKNMLIHELQRIQKERPWIAITMKTKQVIRTTLNAMTEALNELKNSGFVDNVEYNYLEREINEKFKVLRSIQIIRPSSPKVIFNEIPWLTGNKQMGELLYSKLEMVYYDEGDVVIAEGEIPLGVYIVVTGVLKMSYKPKAGVKEVMEKNGAVPVIDYLSSLDFESEMENDIMSGSTFGEKCFLTRRKYDCSIVADSPTQTYLLTHDVLIDAFSLYCNPVTGLEAKMWKCSCINLAVAIMSDVPLYQTLTQQEIKFKLERAFVPNLRCYKVFIITEDMDDVLLLDGIALDYSTDLTFCAPMLIPKNVQKMFISKSSYLDVDTKMDTKLMIIPVPDVKEMDVMMNEEEQGEIVSYTTSKCILHKVHDIIDRKPKIRRKVADADLLTRPSTSITEFREDLRIINLDSRDEVVVRSPESSTSDVESRQKYLVKTEYRLSGMNFTYQGGDVEKPSENDKV